MEKFKKTAAVLLAGLLLLLSLCGAFGAFAASGRFREGTYTGTFEKVSMSGVGIRYTISAAFADGNYSYDVRVQLLNDEYDGEDSTKSGTYTLDGDNLTFTDGNLKSAQMTADGTMQIYGTLSSFAFEPAYAELVWTSDEKPTEGDPGSHTEEPVRYALTEGAAGTYLLGSDSDYVLVCEGALQDFVEVRVDGVLLDAKGYTLSEGSTKVTISGAFLKTLAAGMHRVALVYTDGVSATAMLRVAAAPGTYSDTLQSGDYELKLDDFSSSVGVHRHPCILTIDKTAMTFILHDADDAVTNKGSGTLSFDDATGEYTMTYTAGGPETQEDPTTTFVTVENDLMFTSPLKLGRSMMNIRDESGAFVTYVAKYISTPAKSEDTPSGQTDSFWNKLVRFFRGILDFFKNLFK